MSRPGSRAGSGADPATAGPVAQRPADQRTPANAFERQDFDASVFVPQAVQQPAPAVNPLTAGPTNVDYDVQPVMLPSAIEDETLQNPIGGPTRLYVVVFVAGAFVLAAVAFAAGFVLGKLL